MRFVKVSEDVLALKQNGVYLHLCDQFLNANSTAFIIVLGLSFHIFSLIPS